MNNTEDQAIRMLPSNVGPYTLFDHIGRGGMADIYLARVRTGLGAARLVVLKELLPQLANDEHFAEMLITEAKLAAKLCHPNVVTVEDLGRYDGVLYIAMEYVEGLDLRQLLKQCSRRKLVFPIRFALSTVCHVLKALHYAHRLRDEQGQALGIIHRDVSPSNVLLSFDGGIKLCDFGIASATTAEAVPAPAIEGKAGYMSPEQARGAPLDHRADVFAAGILLWELVCGRRMYKRTGQQRLIDVAARGQVPPLALRGLPDEPRLHAIVRRALQTDRAQRYPSAGDFLGELERYCLATELWMSPMRFGSWLSEHFADEKLQRRRERERAIRALDYGPPLVIEPIAEIAEPDEDDDRSSEVRLKKPSVWVQSRPPARPRPWWRDRPLLTRFVFEVLLTATVAFVVLMLLAAVVR